uniref:Uncharacterized protein n=1 Tax=Panagrolaimus davidi TaxID=227884 RepID=A0A914R6Q7_9BILA
MGNIQKLHVGVVPNIVSTEDFTAVVFETIKDIFYKPVNLFELCCGYFQLEKPDTFPMNEYNRLNQFLDGMICLPIFGENKNVTIILNGHNSSRADSVHMKHENSEISLTTYYMVVYGYNIKHRYWPLAVSWFFEFFQSFKI